MKTILAALLLLASPLHAFDLALEWDANPQEENVTAYAVYEKTTVQGISTYTKVGTATAPVTTININASQASHVYVATATNASGESGYSAELLVTPPPNPPGRIRIKIRIR